MTVTKAASVNAEAIPQELRDLPQWVCWKLLHKQGAAKPTKVPVAAKNCQPASTTDSTTWSTFDVALSAYYGGLGDGVGFVFTVDDPYVGVDLDGCYNSGSGALEGWAQDIVARLSSYTELSPSSTGVHIILKGELPDGRRRTDSIEMYSEGRYFTMTGKLLDQTFCKVELRTEELKSLHHEIFRNESPSLSPSPSIKSGPVPDDADLIRRARAAKNGNVFSKLWQGDFSGYQSHSEADLALCSSLAFWTKGEAVRMDRLFRQSGLFRSKWDEQHGAFTYGQMTVAKALSGNLGTLDTGGPGERNDVAEVNSFPLTDAGNAELFAHLYGDQLRHDHARGRWLVWGGHRWAPDVDGEIYRLAKEAARTRYRAALDIEDLDFRKKVSEFAVRSESRQKLDACLALARSEYPIADAGFDWDTGPFLMGVENGVVDLRTGKLRPGVQEDRITMRVPVQYDERAECPRWEQFLHQVFQCDEQLIGFLQRAVGYSLTGSVREQVLFLCHGSGANGKSVLLTILRHLLGDYAMNIPFTVLELQQRPSLTNDLAAMAGRRLVTSSETNESTRLNEARIKALTGGDPITARFLYSESFTFEPVAKFWLAVNHLPQVRDDSHGFWRRVRVLPFKQRFHGDDADQDLVDKLYRELPGILAWAVQGALNWQVVGLAAPEVVLMATEAYREESDELAGFINDCCVVIDGIRVEPGKAFTQYQHWAEGQGIPLRQRLGLRTFGTRMKERFIAISTNGKRYYTGVGLKVQGQDSDGLTATFHKPPL
ncbi:MAG: phage/plasmid primase, P4 family [Chloroflexi bacterium]|nr:phage/plasmid primase, P4 family [Chloroflexota bacterium]MDA1219431.1 phage/plasmid primase, P4 family [Chloroflexota bacterium]